MAGEGQQQVHVGGHEGVGRAREDVEHPHEPLAHEERDKRARDEALGHEPRETHRLGRRLEPLDHHRLVADGDTARDTFSEGETAGPGRGQVSEQARLGAEAEPVALGDGEPRRAVCDEPHHRGQHFLE